MAKVDVYEEIRALCIEACRAEPTLLRVVSGEQDESTIAADDAHEFLKFDERRLGRDFKLYGLMAQAASVDVALADFAAVICVIKDKIPKAFAAIVERVLRWDRYFDEQHREGWRALWT